MLLNGCQEGKGTPRLVEVLCPKCKEELEVFIKMGGSIGETGCTVSDEICSCGHMIPSGTALTDLELAI